MPVVMCTQSLVDDLEASIGLVRTVHIQFFEWSDKQPRIARQRHFINYIQNHINLSVLQATTIRQRDHSSGAPGAQANAEAERGSCPSSIFLKSWA